MGEIGEERIAERVVSEVLNGAATVGIGSGLLELSVGEVGIALEQDRADGMLPRDVNDCFVGLDGVWDAGRSRQEEDEQRKNFE